MKRVLLAGVFVFVCGALTAAGAPTADLGDGLVLRSLNGGVVSVTFDLDEAGTPVYSVEYKGRTVVSRSALGLELKQGGPLSRGMRVDAVEFRTHDSTYPLAVGKASRARDRYYEMTVSLREQGGIFGFFDHLEQTADFEDTLVVDIAPGDGTVMPKAWAIWNSQLPEAIRDYDPTATPPIHDTNPATGQWRGEVPMPPVSHPLFGQDAVVVITVTPR